MRRRRHKPEPDGHGIDLAPMLDFVLNLLIFFIITTSFVKEAGVTVTRPDGSRSTTGSSRKPPAGHTGGPPSQASTGRRPDPPRTPNPKQSTPTPSNQPPPPPQISAHAFPGG